MCAAQNSSFRPGSTSALLLGTTALLLAILPSSFAASGQTSSPQALWAAYWTIEPGYTSTLEMKNNLVQSPLDVTISLYFANGEEYPLSPITIGPRQTVVLDISSVIGSLPPAVRARAGTQGTLEVDFNAATPSALMGSVSVANPVLGTAWNFFLYAQRPDPAPLPLRGVFWFPNDQSDGFIALQNISQSPVSISPRFEVNSHSYPITAITLASGQGLKFELRKELNKLGLKDATAGGIEFTYQGTPDAVKAHGALFDDRGFSAEMDFIRYDSSTDGQTFSLRTPRFAIGQADPILGLPSQTTFEPVVAFHNFESDSLNITLLVGFMQGNTQQTVTIPLTVLPGNTPVISLHRYLQSIPPEVSWASLQVSYTAGQGDLTAAMVSTSQDGEHSIRSVLNWVEGSNREGWYWRADSQRDTLVSILNTDTQDARVAISLDYYQDGVARSYDLPERTLPPAATSLLDIGAIIASGKPDTNGKYFPLGVNFGGYHVRKIGQHIDKTITTEALVFDRRSKTFTTFYNTCCGMTGPTFNPGLFSGPEGPLGNFLNQATDYCSGQTIDVTGSSTFSSENTAVSTVTTAGAVSGVGIGGTNSDSFLTYFQQKTVDTCIQKNASTQKPTTVSPTVTIGQLSQNPILQGSTATATITVNPSATISLTITSSGSGAAKFDNQSGSTTKTISGTTTVTIYGNTASTNSGDLTLTASYNGTPVTTTAFTVTTGPCTLASDHDTGAGKHACPSTVTLQSMLNISQYCSTCKFQCSGVHTDGTWTPSTCSTITPHTDGLLTATATTSATGTFSASDCNTHYAYFVTTFTNAQGVVTNVTGGNIGLECTLSPNGGQCP
jgi:hypothetical protein